MVDLTFIVVVVAFFASVLVLAYLVIALVWPERL